MNNKLIELLSRCIEDLLLTTVKDNYECFAEVGLLPESVHICQRYIIKSLLVQLDETVKKKLLSDSILYLLINEKPYSIHQDLGGFSPSGTLFYTKEWLNIGIKYKTDWKQLYNYFQGNTENWWRYLSSEWMNEIRKPLFCIERHHERVFERKIALITVKTATKKLPAMYNDILYHIISYL